MRAEDIDDPRARALREELRLQHGTRTGTFTFNDVTYTDMNEVEWRQANNEWLKAPDKSLDTLGPS